MTSSTVSRGPGSLCAGFMSALPVQHAAISTLGDPFELETVCASDPLAARLDELQLDLGEGPCWQARARRAPVLVPDLRSGESWWPILQAAIEFQGIRSAYAFPLSVGSLAIGAVDLYAASPDALSADDVAEASALADVAAVKVLHHALALVNEPPDDALSSRRVVHQATGMVIAQLGVTADDALVIVRAHAFATDRPVRDVAADIIARQIVFSV